MKKKTNIKTVIRNIVREEVAMAIHEVITELKQPPQVMTAATGEIRRNDKPKKKIVEKQNYTNNSVLNDVLNETANTDSDWPTMGDKPFSTANMGNVLQSQYGDMMNGGKPSGNQMVASMGIDPTSVAPEVIDNIFNKDYSTLLKKMDEKSKQTRGA